METSFKCAKCGNQLDSTDNTNFVSGLELRIQKLEAELSR